jgi:hypothetical protein
MSQWHIISGSTPRSSQRSGPHIRLELSLRSEVSAISPFVDTLMHLIRKCQWVTGNEEDVEIAFREALANAVIQATMKILRNKCTLAAAVGLTKFRSSSGMKDKGLTLATSQTQPLRRISSPAMAVEST